MMETYEEMKGTMFQYSGLREYVKDKKGNINPVNYLECYKRTPQIEILSKMGLVDIVESLVGYEYGIIADEDANRLDKFLGIRKERNKAADKTKRKSKTSGSYADGEAPRTALDR